MRNRSLMIGVLGCAIGLASSGQSCSAQTCPTPAALATSLSTAPQASVLSLSGVSPLTCPEIAMRNTWTGGELIFSDSPEYPDTSGILYQDGSMPATSGTNYHRVFVYHVNGSTAGPQKFAVILTNLGTVTGSLTVHKKGIAGPSTSYLYVGKVAFERWLNSTAAAPVNVIAGGSVELDTTFDALNVSYSALLHGIWDYSFDQPHQITVCSLDPADDPVSVCPTLAVLPRDTHQRGTFPNADKIYDTAAGVTIDTVNGIQQLPLAGNSANDPAAVGVDATDSSPVTLGGNYGIVYHMHLQTKATDSKRLGFLFNPRGGGWAGAVRAEPGLTPGGVFLIPAGTGSVCCNTEGALEGSYQPGAGLTVWLQFMPTGSASLPLRFMAVPF